ERAGRQPGTAHRAGRHPGQPRPPGPPRGAGGAGGPCFSGSFGGARLRGGHSCSFVAGDQVAFTSRLAVVAPGILSFRQIGTASYRCVSALFSGMTPVLLIAARVCRKGGGGVTRRDSSLV